MQNKNLVLHEKQFCVEKKAWCCRKSNLVSTKASWCCSKMYFMLKKRAEVAQKKYFLSTKVRWCCTKQKKICSQKCY